MSQRQRKRLIQNLSLLLASLLVMVGLLEVLLRTVDPLGVDTLVNSLWSLSRNLDDDDPRGFGLPPGRYRLNGWTITIDESRNRVTPNAQEADCEIVFVGDSVTIGQGVDDEDVWVNLLAAESDAEFINAGFSGYNIYQVNGTLRSREADGYVYLLVENDYSINVPFETNYDRGSWQLFLQTRLLRATYAYLAVMRTGGLQARQDDTPIRSDVVIPEAELAPFLETLESILARDDVLVLAMEDSALTDLLVVRYGEAITPIEGYTSVLSWMDAHADAAGNRQLAESAADPIEAFVQETCSDT